MLGVCVLINNWIRVFKMYGIFFLSLLFRLKLECILLDMFSYLDTVSVAICSYHLSGVCNCPGL